MERSGHDKVGAGRVSTLYLFGRCSKLLTVVAIAAVILQLPGATLARYAIIRCGESGGEALKETARGE